ncbi:PD-(D/E)XK nuclease family protein [Brucella sp. H1_1004]|uniref:PDDEXK-like family protein n=1 Tax=Brucella sp. H1_1004 TaxID=3110109 RepID=UPI0039B425A5
MAKITADRYEPSYDELEQLFVNNEALLSIEKHLNKFNPIKVMKMQGMEIRHSAILAWLLDPKETHGLADSFLKAFLAEALRGNGLSKKPNALQISQADLRNAEVRSEWKNIDIFILSPENRWAFIIENKVYSSQRKSQLSDYRQRIEELYRIQATDIERPLDIIGIFLTLNDEIPEDGEYVPIRYGAVCNFIRLYLNHEAYLLQPEVTTFLTHYMHVLEELMGNSSERTEMEALARKMYREHKKVLDFILEHGAGSDFALAAHRIFGDNPNHGDEFNIRDRKFTYTGLNARTFSFVPASWLAGIGGFSKNWKGCEKWWAGLPFICWMEIVTHADGKQGHLKIVAEIGPLEDYEFRKRLIEGIEDLSAEHNLSIGFQSGAKQKGTMYSRFLRRNTEKLDDVQNSEEIFRKIEILIHRFNDAFDRIGVILPELCKDETLVIQEAK